MSRASFGMPLRWRKQSHQPPIPYVEDETDSLSRELNGSSRAGEMPGFEGAKARGSVNQSTLIEDIEIPNAPKNSSYVEEKSAQGKRPSGFNANQSIPKDTSGPKQNRQPAGETQSQGSGKPSQRSQPRSQDLPSSKQPLKPSHTQGSEPPKSSPVTQKPISRQPEPVPRASGPLMDTLPSKPSPKPMPEMAQNPSPGPSRSPSLHRPLEQHKTSSTTKYTQPEPSRHSGARTSSPAKSTPKVTQPAQPASSLKPSLREKEQHKTSPPTRYAQPEHTRNPDLRTAVPEKPMPEHRSSHSRTSSQSRVQEQHKSSPPTKYAQLEHTRNPDVRTTAAEKPTPEHRTSHSRTSSQARVQEQHKSASPTRHAQPEAARQEKSGSRMRERSQTAPSRTPSRVRVQEHHRSNSPTRYEYPERVQSQVRTSSSPKRMPEVSPQSHPVMSRSSSVHQPRDDYRPMPTNIHPPMTGYPSVPAAPWHPPMAPGVVQPLQSFPSRPITVPQEYQNRPPPTIPYQPAPVQDTYMRGPPLPPKQVLDTTSQAQPMVPRPLPTPPDDEPRKPPRPSSIAYQPNTVIGDSGVRVEKLPPRSVPDAPSTQRSPPMPSEPVQYKSFASSIGPPPPDTPPITQGNPFQTIPVRTATSHPLPNPPAERPPIPSSTMSEPAQVSQVPSAKAPTLDTRPKTVYGSAAPRQDHVPSPVRSVEKGSPYSPVSSVAERLEEKIKIRREQRDHRDTPQNAPQTRSESLRTSNSPASLSPERRGRSSQPPGAWPSDSQSDSSSSRLTQFPNLEQSNREAKPQNKPLKSAMRSQSADRSRSASAKAARRRTVAFAEHPLEYPSKALVSINNENALVQSESQEDGSDSGRSSSPNVGLTLSPCPRSVPVAGYQDWYTIEGLNHLDVCPSCVKQMRKSKFRDRLVLSTARRTEPIRCAMSEPWTRLAWMQTLKKKLETLDLLLEVTRPSNTQGTTKSCTGRIVNEQNWYRITDPETGMYLPQFNVCSACVRKIRLLMPVHRETFQRSTASQERVCDFVTDSPRFIRYIDALDLSSNRAEQDDKSPDLKEFLTYARRKVVLRDCRRSRLVFDKWHFMSLLPEFTVCEDCYDDIIWPLSKARHPIAREFSSAMRALPADTGSVTASGSKPATREGNREASCQLYSPRIRAKFNDAVRRDDMSFVKWMAITRYEAEQRFRGRQDELLEDQRRGYECSEHLRKNLEDWKRYE